MPSTSSLVGVYVSDVAPSISVLHRQLLLHCHLRSDTPPSISVRLAVNDTPTRGWPADKGSPSRLVHVGYLDLYGLSPRLLSASLAATVHLVHVVPVRVSRHLVVGRYLECPGAPSTMVKSSPPSGPLNDQVILAMLVSSPVGIRVHAMKVTTANAAWPPWGLNGLRASYPLHRSCQGPCRLLSAVRSHHLIR